MSNYVLNWAWQQNCGSPAAKLVLIELADQANHDCVCWPSMRYIAARCEMGRKHVNTIIRQLEQRQLLDIHPKSHNGMKSSNEYSFRCPPMPEPQKPPSKKVNKIRCHPQVTTMSPPGYNVSPPEVTSLEPSYNPNINLSLKDGVKTIAEDRERNSEEGIQKRKAFLRRQLEQLI